LLEDDIAISNQFYCWLKFVGLQLQHHIHREQQHIFSISLYTPRVIETGKERRTWINFSDMNLHPGSVFISEVPCSWGSAFAAQYWHEAMTYFERRYSGENIYPPIPHSRVNGWTGSWKRWLIELGHYLHWTTVYPLFAEERSFSTNTLQKGQHISATQQQEEFLMYKVPLFEDNRWYRELREPRLFPIDKSFNLFFTPKSLDFHGLVV
jgi:hypothetical protein